MNMISTGAFLNEMDASTKQPTVAEKFAAVWEKKNAKAARAGGVSLMALSLAACGSSSDDTDSGDAGADDSGSTPVATAGKIFTLASTADTLAPTAVEAKFQTTAGDDTIRAMSDGLLTSADYIDAGDGSDKLQISESLGTAGETIKPTLAGIEAVEITTSSATGGNTAATIDFKLATGVDSITVLDAAGQNHATRTSTLTLDNVDAGIGITVSGGATGGAGVAASLVVGVDGAATATDNVLDIATSNGLLNILTADNIETVNITNSNTASTKSTTITSLDADAMKTLNIDGSGTLTITGLSSSVTTALTKIDINGSGANTITSASGTQTKLATIDASDATGNNTVNITGGAISNTTITMGAGNDTVRYDTTANITTALGNTGAITGGEGTDTLKFDTETAFDSTDAAIVKKATSFEKLNIAEEISGATNADVFTLTANAFAIDEFVFSGSHGGDNGKKGSNATNATDARVAVTVTGVENDDTFVFSGDYSGGTGATADAAANTVDEANGAAALSFAAATNNSENVLNLTLAASGTVKTDAVVITGAAGVDSNTAANEDGKDGVIASEFETVNLSSTGVNVSGTFANANDIIGGAAAGGTAGNAITLGTNATLKITGNKHLDLTDGIGGTDVKIDASEFTGALKVLANTGANIIIGGSGSDTLDGSTGTDTFTTGAGKDTIIMDDGDAGWTTAETIKDFDIANDKLDMTGTKTAIANVITPTNVVSALSGAVAGDTLTAAVSNGVITLAGTAVSKVDTATEVKAIVELLDDDGVDAEIAVLEIATGTYVQTEASGGDTAGDLLFLEGTTGIVKVSTVSGDGTLLIA